MGRCGVARTTSDQALGWPVRVGHGAWPGALSGAPHDPQPVPASDLGSTMPSKTKAALALSVVWAMSPPMASAQQAADTDGSVARLDEVTVSSTRIERRVDQVPNTVTVTPAATMEQAGARDIKDALRDELDVTVRAAPARFTAAGSATGRAGNEG